MGRNQIGKKLYKVKTLLYKKRTIRKRDYIIKRLNREKLYRDKLYRERLYKEETTLYKKRTI